MREQALLLASEDLCPLLEKSGLMQDARNIQEEVDYLLTPITNIKLTYMDQVSNVTGSVRQEADAESTLSPPEINSSTHYHAVVCNSSTCLGDRVITTPCLTPQNITPNAFNSSPPHQTTSSPQKFNQAPREHAPPSAQLVSREELHSAIANMFHNMQDMLTTLHTQTKGGMAMPLHAQHTHNKPRQNRVSRPSCHCGSPSSKEPSLSWHPVP